MKKQQLISTLSFALLTGVVATLQSCNKLAQKLNFNLAMQTETVQVSIPPTQGTFTVGPVSTYYNVDSFVRASTVNQFGAANISSVQVTSAVLVVNNPTPTNNVANFQSCSASFYSNTDNTPYTLSIPSNPDVYATSLSIPVDQTELAPYIGNTFNYSFTGTLRRPTTTTLNCTITFTYSVKVKG